MTLCSTTLGHQMPLPGKCQADLISDCKCHTDLMYNCSWPLEASTGGYIWLSTAFSLAFLNMSSWPDVVLLLTTRCLYWGDTSDLSAKRTSVILNTLCITEVIFYERPIKLSMFYNIWHSRKDPTNKKLDKPQKRRHHLMCKCIKSSRAKLG